MVVGVPKCLVIGRDCHSFFIFHKRQHWDLNTSGTRTRKFLTAMLSGGVKIAIIYFGKFQHQWFLAAALVHHTLKSCLVFLVSVSALAHRTTQRRPNKICHTAGTQTWIPLLGHYCGHFVGTVWSSVTLFKATMLDLSLLYELLNVFLLLILRKHLPELFCNYLKNLSAKGNLRYLHGSEYCVFCNLNVIITFTWFYNNFIK